FARIGGAFVGTAAALLAALTTRNLFGRQAGLLVGLLFALEPSLVVWSATLIKEPLVCALELLALWTITRWRQAAAWELGVLLLATRQVLASIRMYTGFGLAALLAIALVFSLIGRLWRIDHRSPRWWGVIATSVVGLALMIWLLLPGLQVALRPVRLTYL